MGRADVGVVVGLSLCSAVAYGLSDFLGGLFARKASAWAVAAASQGTAAILSALLVISHPGEPAVGALLWGILGGLGSGAGNVLIYRGLAEGRMAVVAPVSAISAPWLPRDRFSRLGAVAGVLAGIATICFQLAVQSGMLAIAGVLASLYPAVTVLLAALVLREPIHRAQGIGLALGAGAVGLIAAG